MKIIMKATVYSIIGTRVEWWPALIVASVART